MSQKVNTSDISQQAEEYLRRHGGPGGDLAGAGVARRTVEARIAQNQFRGNSKFSAPELNLNSNVSEKIGGGE